MADRTVMELLASKEASSTTLSSTNESTTSDSKMMVASVSDVDPESKVGQSRRKRILFKPVILEVDEELVDPKETLALALFGPKVAEYVFSLWFTPDFHHRYSKIRIASILLMYSSGTCAILSLFGVYPDLGWASFASLPMFFQTILNYNSKLLRKVISSFECQCLIGLDAIAIGSLMDAVKFQTPRVLSLCVVGLGLFLVTILDARTCSTTPNRPLIINLLGYVAAAWITLIFFWLNLFIDIRITTWQLFGPIELQVQSVGMSALTTYAFLCSKTIWKVWKSTEINPRVGLRPSIAYRAIEVDE